jgi:hypothetical protein
MLAASSTFPDNTLPWRQDLPSIGHCVTSTGVFTNP